jgi:primosomal protein N'
VVLPDLDGSLLRPTLDASEDLLRLATAVAGWAVHGRSDPRDSRVVIQTTHPDHHAILALATWDPGGFWRAEAALRAPLRFPPLAHAMRIEVAGAQAGAAADLRGSLADGDELLGPIPVDGRQGFLVKSDDRDRTLAALRPWRERLSREGTEVRLDVDPVDAI